MNYKIMGIYPPGSQFQRSEERCQASIEESTTVTQRACNDLGYIGSIARKYGFDAFIRDYPTEGLSFADLKRDIIKFKPNLIIISSTIPTLREDAETANKIKSISPDTSIMIKGSEFSTIRRDEINQLEKYLKDIDLAVKGEIEAVLNDFLEFFTQKIKNNRKFLFKDFTAKDFKEVKGLIYKDNGKWIVPNEIRMVDDLDSLPFPARDLMRNDLYIRPDTGKPMATIETARGCPNSCIYCLTPIISGKRLRYRTPESLIAEIEECIIKYNIREFFFRSDTFTISKAWVERFCSLILEKGLKISWTANSRVKPLHPDTLKLMKKAGCWLVAFGFEVGSNENLKKIKKGTTIQDAFNAVKWAKDAGLETYGFYMFGFPWETKKDIMDTINLSLELDCDYAEFHIVAAFKNTELFNMLDIKELPIGINYFSAPNKLNPMFTIEDLLWFRKLALRKYYLRPRYIFKRIIRVKSLYQLKTYFNYGIKTLKKILKK